MVGRGPFLTVQFLFPEFVSCLACSLFGSHAAEGLAGPLNFHEKVMGAGHMDHEPCRASAEKDPQT